MDRQPIRTNAAGAPRHGGQVTATFALPNTTEEGPRRRFLVRPSDYRTAEQEASRQGLELLGFYHSHPDHPARPSQLRSRSRVADLLVRDRVGDGGSAAAMTSWRLRDDRSAFDEER